MSKPSLRGKIHEIDFGLSSTINDIKNDMYKETKSKPSSVKVSSWINEKLTDLKLVSKIVEEKCEEWRGLNANVQNLADMFIMLFIFSISVLVIGLVLYNMQASGGPINTGVGGAILAKVNIQYPSVWDKLFAFVLVGLMTITTIITYLYRVSSFWFFFSIIILGLYVIAVFNPISVAFDQFISTDQFATFALQFPIMLWFFQHSITVMLAFAIIILIVNHYSPGGIQSEVGY